MDSKHFLQSKTIIGIISALVGFVLKLAVTKGWISVEVSGLVSEFIAYLADFLGFGGLAFAAYGRAKTNGEPLTVTKAKEAE